VGYGTNSAGQTDAFLLTPILTWTGTASGNWNTAESNWQGVGVATTYKDAFPVTFDDTSSGSNVTIQPGGVNPASVTFNNNVVPYTFIGGAIAGTAGLVLNGTGTVTLSNSNSYTGGTSVNQGKLVVAGSLGNTAVTVGPGASLGGTGTIGGTVTVAGGSGPSVWGTISLVDGAAGTLTLSDVVSADTVLTLGGGGGSPSALNFEVGAAADRILITAGKLLVNPGGSLLNITALPGFGPGSYDLMDFPSGQASGLGNLSLATTSLNGYALSLLSTPTAEQLVVSSVPEPSSLALLFAGTAGLLAHAWRRRRAGHVWHWANSQGAEVGPQHVRLPGRA
jgi:autotransporter-associated beta strand protein